MYSRQHSNRIINVIKKLFIGELDFRDSGQENSLSDFKFELAFFHK